jgi:hypothetical protein
VEDCTLVIGTEIMDYMSHWTAEASSPFPDRRAAATWYSTDETCKPPEVKRFLLLDKVRQRWGGLGVLDCSRIQLGGITVHLVGAFCCWQG